MIDKLKKQQDKLLFSERHMAWETVARKLAHEIKNPLTPIQLIIDSLRNKYSQLFFVLFLIRSIFFSIWFFKNFLLLVSLL